MGTGRNDEITINFAWHKVIDLSTFFVYDRLNIPDSMRGGMSSGIATPGHTRASAHIKFAGARVKIVWKAKVKDQV